MRLLDDQQCAVKSGRVHISILDGALWDGWQVRCGMGKVGLSLLLCNRSVQIVVWYLWCWDLLHVIRVCIRFHVIFVSCDCIMKCIFVCSQVVNKQLLLLSFDIIVAEYFRIMFNNLTATVPFEISADKRISWCICQIYSQANQRNVVLFDIIWHGNTSNTSEICIIRH